MSASEEDHAFAHKLLAEGTHEGGAVTHEAFAVAVSPSGSSQKMERFEVGACVEEPALQPGALAGALCPIETVYNHYRLEHPRRTCVSYALGGLLLMLVAAQTTYAVLEYSELTLVVGGDGAPVSDAEMEQIVDDNIEVLQQAHSVLNTFRWAQAAVFLLAACYFFIRIYKKHGERAPGPPTVVEKCICPVSTTYYHEQNTINEKSVLACCCGCLYTVPFYRPSYEQRGAILIV